MISATSTMFRRARSVDVPTPPKFPTFPAARPPLLGDPLANKLGELLLDAVGENVVATPPSRPAKSTTLTPELVRRRHRLAIRPRLPGVFDRVVLFVAVVLLVDRARLPGAERGDDAAIQHLLPRFLVALDCPFQRPASHRGNRQRQHYAVRVIPRDQPRRLPGVREHDDELRFDVIRDVRALRPRQLPVAFALRVAVVRHRRELLVHLLHLSAVPALVVVHRVRLARDRDDGLQARQREHPLKRFEPEQ
eukprot:31257-Pelagococcus_subviridis.AAC.8